MSKKYYRVYFDWSCTPETHWGEPCDDKVVIESYEDSETYFDHESDEEKTIASHNFCFLLSLISLERKDTLISISNLCQ